MLKNSMRKIKILNRLSQNLLKEKASVSCSLKQPYKTLFNLNKSYFSLLNFEKIISDGPDHNLISQDINKCENIEQILKIYQSKSKSIKQNEILTCLKNIARLVRSNSAAQDKELLEKSEQYKEMAIKFKNNIDSLNEYGEYKEKLCFLMIGYILYIFF